MENNSFKLLVQAALNKAKSIANIKRDLKEIEGAIKPIKLQGNIDSSKTRRNINNSLKNVKAKIKVDADTREAERKIRRITRNANLRVTPTIDNTALNNVERQTTSFFGKLTNNIAGLNIFRIVFQQITQAIRESIRTVKELDTIKTDIQMASGTNDFEVDGMLKSYNKLAKELKTTTKAVSEASNEFIRMGESVADTDILIANSQMLSKIGMISSADAAQYLISGMKGYKIAAKDSIGIIDKLTSVDMEAAISASGLAEAISKCANIANDSGTSMERLIGYTATVGETTQKSMSEVGNSFQSIYSRMNNIKIGKFIDDETGESLSDTEAVLNKLDIKLRDTKDTYRDFDNVLDDIGENWNSFTQVEKNSISVAIAGTRQRENFTALMNNYGNALKYAETAANSAGTAMERYAIYQDSIAANTDRLTAAFESLSMNTFSENLYNDILKAATGLVEFVDKANLLKGTLAGIASLGILKTVTAIGAGMVTAARSTAQLTAAMKLFDNGRSADNLQMIGLSTKGLSDSQLRLLLSTKGLTNAQRLQILAGRGVAAQDRQSALATLGFAEAEDVATVSTFSFKGALNTLKVAWATNPIGIAIMGITTAVTVATMAVSKFKQDQEELAQSTQQAAQANKDSLKAIEDYSDRYKALHDELTDANTTEERQSEIKSELLELQQELNDKYGDEYDKVNLVTGAYEDQIATLQKLNKEVAQQYLHENAKGISKAKTVMTTGEDYFLANNVSSGSEGGKALRDLVKEYEKFGMEIKEQASSGTFSVKLKADPTQAKATINDFMTDVDQLKQSVEDTSSLDKVYNTSSQALGEANKRIEKYGEQYNQALLNEIVISDTLSTEFSKAVKAVDAFNTAMMSGDTKKIEDAKVKLDSVKNAIDLSSEAWKPYASVINDVFDQADTRLFDFADRLKNGDFSWGMNEASKKTITELKAINDAGDIHDPFVRLVAGAKEYGLSLEEVISVLQQLGVIQESTFGNGDTLDLSYSDTIAELDKMSKSFSALDESYAKFIAKDKNIGFEDLQNISEQFKDVSGIESFVKAIQDAKGSAEETQVAFNNLLTAYMNQSGILEEVNEGNAKLIESYLEEQGVVNADIIVQDALQHKLGEIAAQKYMAANASFDLANATGAEINAFIDEAVNAGVARASIIELMMAKISCNETGIVTDGDINNLIALANAAGIAEAAIRNAKSAQSQKNANGVVRSAGADNAINSSIADNLQGNIREELYKPKEYQYSGGAATNSARGANSKKGGGSKKEKKAQEKEFDWIKTALEAIERKRQDVADIIDDENVSYQRQLALMDELLENDEEMIRINEEALDNYENQWVTIRQRIIEAFGEIEGNSLIEKVMNGNVSEDGWKDSFTYNSDDEEMADKITLIDDAMSVYASFIGQEDNLKKKLEQRTEDLKKQFKIRVDEIKAAIEELDSEMSQLESDLNIKETTGRIITEGDYRSMIRAAEDQIDLQYDQIDALEDYLDELEEGSAEWYGVKSQIAGCNESIRQCEENQAKWNEEILNLPVRRIERFLEILGIIKQKLQNYIDEEASRGNEATQAQLQELINLSAKQIDKLKEEHEELVKRLSNYEYGSDKFNEVKQNIQDCDDEISSLIQSQIGYNQQILQIPINKISELKDQLTSVKDALDGITEDYDTAIGAVTQTIERQVKSVEELKEATEEAYDAKVKPLQDELDMLNKQNEARKIQLNLEQAAYDLERAKNQKTTQVVRNGEIGYEEDIDAARNANAAKQDALFEKKKYDIQTQIDSLEEERDKILEDYDKQIEKLDQIKDRWSEIADNIKYAQDMAKANEVFGKDDWKSDVLSGNDNALYDAMVKNYENIESQKELYQKQIDTTEKMSTLMQQYIEAYQQGTMTFDQVVSKFDELVLAAKDGFTSQENLDAILSQLGSKDVSSALSGLQNEITGSYDTFKEYLGVVEANSKTFSEYTSTWEEIKNAVTEQLEVLKKLAEEEAKRVSNSNKSSSGHKGSGGSSGGSSKGPDWNTPDSAATGPGKESELKETAERTKKKKGQGPAAYKDGLEMGPVQKSGTKDTELIEKLGLTKSSPDEVFAMLHEGEQVINPEQQDQLVSNVQSAVAGAKRDIVWRELSPDEIFERLHVRVSPTKPKQQEQIGPNMHEMRAMQADVFDAKANPLAGVELKQTKVEPHVEVNMGGVKLEGVDNVDKLCNEIIHTFDSRMTQRFSAYFR